MGSAGARRHSLSGIKVVLEGVVNALEEALMALCRAGFGDPPLTKRTSCSGLWPGRVHGIFRITDATETSRLT